MLGNGAATAPLGAAADFRGALVAPPPGQQHITIGSAQKAQKRFRGAKRLGFATQFGVDPPAGQRSGKRIVQETIERSRLEARGLPAGIARR